MVLASSGYPDSFPKGFEINGLEKSFSENINIFQAGTSLKDNKLVTNGGRVLCVTSVAETLQKSLDMNYQTIDSINFEGMFYRKDIGQKAFKYFDAVKND